MKRNPLRKDEKWNISKLQVMEQELCSIKVPVVVSGGWAWHYISPPHLELKIFHDHKDIDIFVKGTDFADLIGFLITRGYERFKTIHDKKSKDFYRYGKLVQHPIDNTLHKVLFDIFIEEVPYVDLGEGLSVVEPNKLLSFYSTKQHSTDDCVAVREARKLINKGIDPIQRSELIKEN